MICTGIILNQDKIHFRIGQYNIKQNSTIFRTVKQYINTDNTMLVYYYTFIDL